MSNPAVLPGLPAARSGLTRPRLASVDALRGLVMVIMAIDHVRDFMHTSAMAFSPTDLSKTTPILFFTRWITHFCLPAFMFTAGAGAYFWWRARNHTRNELARFLLTRGIWFVLLELTVMQFAYNFGFSSRNLVLLLVLYIFGVCFVVMAGLVYLPQRVLLAVGLAVVGLHNLLDGIAAPKAGLGAWLWHTIHQPGVLQLGQTPVLITYTILPWIGVLSLGFCFGRVFDWPRERRRKLMTAIGALAILLFILLRALNGYGDPAPWSPQRSMVFTALSFLNCTKYPGSLDFLLMTLGPAMLTLALLDGRQFSSANPLLVFGRVPMFYFVLHMYLIHLVVVAYSLARYGKAALNFVFHPVPSFGGPAALFPNDFGVSLWAVYLVWFGVVTALYPICRWFAAVKGARKAWWLSYL